MNLYQFQLNKYFFYKNQICFYQIFIFVCVSLKASNWTEVLYLASQ